LVTKEIVFVAGKDPEEEIGGHSSYVRSHARAAIRAGYEPHLFCVSRAAAAGIEETSYGVVHRVKSPYARTRRISGMGFRSNWVVLHAPLLRRGIARFLAKKTGHFLVHGFGVWGCAGAAVQRDFNSRRLRATALVHAYGTILHENDGKRRGLKSHHGLFPWVRFNAERLWIRFALQRYERIAYRESRIVLINYDSVQRLISEKWGPGISFSKMTYAPETSFIGDSRSALLPQILSRLSPAEAPLLVSASRQDLRKGVDVLLRALARLRGEGTFLRACLLGGGPLLSAHRQLAERLCLEASVVLPGFVPDSFEFTRSADIFAVPSLEEGSGSVALLEAMQAGVAIVASNVDGIPEDVTDGVDALLVEPASVGELADAIRRLTADGALRARLAAGARKTFEERFSSSALASALGEVYAGLERESPSTLA
jgi:glycosyltransferase involved in cell wall biosynthesis